MPYTYDQVIELARRSGIPNDPGSTLRPGDRTTSGSLSFHDKGWAVDFMGESQDALAAFFMSFPTMEVIHHSKATGKYYGWNGSRGRAIDPNLPANQALFKEHENHLHVAMSPEQLGPDSVLDQLRKGLKPILGIFDPSVAGKGLDVLTGIIPTPANVTEALSNIGKAMTSVAQSAMNIGQVANLITRAFLPSNILRGVSLAFGTIFILIGILFLASEVKESKA